MPNSPRGAPQGARIPQRILLGGSKIPRGFCVRVPKTGEAKFPMTPGNRGKKRRTKASESFASNNNNNSVDPIPSHAGQEYAATALKIGLQSSLLYTLRP